MGGGLTHNKLRPALSMLVLISSGLTVAVVRASLSGHNLYGGA